MADDQSRRMFHVEHSSLPSGAMGQAIAICNQKGGVGKSTTAVNLGAYLALAGKRTLLIDLDPQGNATTACGIDRRSVQKDTYEVLINGAPADQAIAHTAIELLDLLPSTINLAGAEAFFSTQEERETVLRSLCINLRASYDVILFDCPPALGVLTVNALVAADSTIIPVQCEYLALEGLNALMQSIQMIRQRLNPALRVGGIVLTMTDFRANLNREVAEEVKRYFSELVFDTTIPRNIRLAECPSFGKPICLYDKNSTGALAYQLLAQEVILKRLHSEPAKTLQAA